MSARPPNSNAQAVAAAALAAGQTIKDSAAAAGVNEKTVRRWLKETSEFKSRVEELRSEAVSAAMNRLSTDMTAAAAVLAGLLKSRIPIVRLRAAKVVIEVGMKLKDHADLEQRVRELEAKLLGTSR